MRFPAALPCCAFSILALHGIAGAQYGMGATDFDGEYYNTVIVDPLMVAVWVLPLYEPTNHCSWNMVVDDWPDPVQEFYGPGFYTQGTASGYINRTGWDMRMGSAFGQLFAELRAQDEIDLLDWPQYEDATGNESRSSDSWARLRRTDSSDCGAEFSVLLKPKFQINTGIHDDASFGDEEVNIEAQVFLTVPELNTAAELTGHVVQTDDGASISIGKLSAGGLSISLALPANDEQFTEHLFVHPLAVGGPEDVPEAQILTQEVFNTKVHADGWDFDYSLVSGYAHSSFAGGQMLSICIPGDDMAADECVGLAIMQVSWY